MPMDSGILSALSSGEKMTAICASRKNAWTKAAPTTNFFLFLDGCICCAPEKQQGRHVRIAQARHYREEHPVLDRGAKAFLNLVFAQLFHAPSFLLFSPFARARFILAFNIRTTKIGLWSGSSSACIRKASPGPYRGSTPF